MAHLDKLVVQNIRSFGEQAGSITFFSPLTLIVGYNGSGKTTIIECLKYATTGEQPPNSKNGAFVHDPGLEQESEILAKVQLRFINTHKKVMTVSRRLKSIAKKGTQRTIRTLEASLAAADNGERTVISSKLADIDKIGMEYMGVSRAILDNVIFCHQDESLWPMSEPSALKKRFDEIFEAQKYTKAIDNIKVLRKTQNEELKTMKVIEQNAKEDKNRGDEIASDLKRWRDESEGLQGKILAIEDELRDAQEKWSDAGDNFAKHQATVHALENKRMERNIKQEAINDTRSTIGKYLHESEQQLEEMLQQHQTRLNANDEEQRKRGQHYNEIDTRSKDVDQQLGLKRSQHGRFQAEKEHYDNQVQRRKSLVKQTARCHGVRGFDHDLSSEEVKSFIDRVGNMAKDQQAALQRAEREMKQMLWSAQQQLNSLNTKKSTLRNDHESAKSRNSDIERQVSELQRKLNGISVNEGDKAQLESRLEDIEEQLAKATGEASKANFDHEIRNAEQGASSLDAQRSTLQADLIRFNAQSQQSAKIDFLTKTLRDSKRSLDTMMGAHRQRITEMIGQAWKAENVEEAFREARSQRQSEIKEAERLQQSKVREHVQADIRVRKAHDDLTEKRQAMQQHAQDILAAIERDDVDEYPDVLRELSEERDVCKSDVDNFTALKEYYENCLSTLEKKNACRLCKRAFEPGDPAKSKFHQKLQEVIRPEALLKAQEELTIWQAKLDKVRALSTKYESWRKLSAGEIHRAEQEVDRLGGELSAVLAQLERLDQNVSDAQSGLKELESISKTVQSIAQYGKEASKCEREMEELSQKQSQSGAPIRGLDEIQAHIGRTDDELKSARSRIARLQEEEKASRAKVTGLEVEVRDVRAKLRDVEYAIGQRDEVSGRVEELRGQSRQVRGRMAECDREGEQLGPQIAEAQARVDDIDSRWADQQRELRGRLDQLTESSRSIESASQEIVTFEQKNGGAQLERSQQEMTELEGEKQRLQRQLLDVAGKINRLRDEKSNQAEHQRVVRQNLKYRQDRRAVEELEAQIAEMVKRNAEEDVQYWQGEVDKWQAERNRLSSSQAAAMAQQGAKDDQIKEALKRWDEFYKGAKRAYTEAHIRVEVTKAAIEDLGRYGLALDKAIMKFHSMKMEEINRILEDLWRDTYRGGDIDKVLIRSDDDRQSGTRKSYNYRVCMVKSNVEMDMRGRCSAGQKVLASILIRLALAECFSANCGVIALDEPTTNLDHDNIQSLAESLHHIIKSRRKQKGFQLIVITHDEDFLRYMHCSSFADDYWKVLRNDREQSVIVKQKVSEVSE